MKFRFIAKFAEFETIFLEFYSKYILFCEAIFGNFPFYSEEKELKVRFHWDLDEDYMRA